jgi:hypothetical protein
MPKADREGTRGPRAACACQKSAREGGGGRSEWCSGVQTGRRGEGAQAPMCVRTRVNVVAELENYGGCDLTI